MEDVLQHAPFEGNTETAIIHSIDAQEHRNRNGNDSITSTIFSQVPEDGVSHQFEISDMPTSVHHPNDEDTISTGDRSRSSNRPTRQESRSLIARARGGNNKAAGHYRNMSVEQTLVRLTDDMTLIVWDLSTAEQLATLKGHTDFVTCCAVFDNDRKALSGSGDNSLTLWDLSTGELLATLKGHTDCIRCCAAFDNDSKALSSSDDNVLIIWDISTGKQLAKLEGHTEGVDCCAVFDNDKKVLTGGWGKMLIVWDLSTCKQLFKFKGRTAMVNSCAVFENDRKALSDWNDLMLAIWEFLSITCETEFADNEREREK